MADRRISAAKPAWRTIEWMRERPWHVVLERFLWTLPKEDAYAYVTPVERLYGPERRTRARVEAQVEQLRAEYDHACYV